jgi:hypothetical protein
MTNEQIIIWMYVVGLFSTYGFIQDTSCHPLVRVLVLLFWPVAIPAATILGVGLRVWEIWRA